MPRHNDSPNDKPRNSRRDFLKKSALFGTLASLPLTRAAQLAAQDAAPAAAETTAAVEAATTRETYTVSMSHLVSRRSSPPRKITIPNVGEFMVLKGDFHEHTMFSDGTVWPRERVSEAVDNGLDALTISDHIEYRPHVGGNGIKLRDHNDDYNFSVAQARPEAEKRNILLVHATEITKSTMPPGHFNALFLKDANPVAAVVSDYRKMIEVAAAQGAFILWNHPGWQAPKSGGIERGAPITFTDAHEALRKDGLLHGVEAFNGSEYYPNVVDWVEEKELAIFANSDIHRSEFDTYGHQNPLRPITLVLAKERTLDSMKEAMFAGRTVGWAAGLIFGREKWVKPLFESCVEIKREGIELVMTNLGSIPCTIRTDLAERVLTEEDKTVRIRSVGKTITVANWLVGQGKPLTVDVP